MRSTLTVLMARVQCTCTLSKWSAFFVKWEIGMTCLLYMYIMYMYCAYGVGDCLSHFVTKLIRNWFALGNFYHFHCCMHVCMYVCMCTVREYQVQLHVFKLSLSCSSDWEPAQLTAGHWVLVQWAVAHSSCLQGDHRGHSYLCATGSPHSTTVQLQTIIKEHHCEYTCIHLHVHVLLLHVQVLIQVCIYGMRWENFDYMYVHVRVFF